MTLVDEVTYSSLCRLFKLLWSKMFDYIYSLKLMFPAFPFNRKFIPVYYLANCCTPQISLLVYRTIKSASVQARIIAYLIE